MTTALSLSRPAFGELRGNWPVFLPELHERFRRIGSWRERVPVGDAL